MPVQWKNTQRQYGAVARFFHWVIAAAVIIMLALGLYISRLEISPQLFTLLFWHKSIGITILALALMRLLWAFTAGRPAPLASHKKWEKRLAKIIHGLLYFSLFAMPVSGWVMSSAKGFPVSVFGWFTLPDIVAKNDHLAERAEIFHYYMAMILIAAIILHVSGALKHHIIDRDSTLRRMLPFGKV